MIFLLLVLFAPLVWFACIADRPATPPIRVRQPHGNPIRAWRETKGYGDEREGWKG